MNGDGYSSRDGGGRHGSGRDYQPRDDRRDDRRDRDRDRDRERDRDRGNRRRSRSPEYRGGRGPGARRDGGGGLGGEVDSYSASRTHRDREREDRYSGRDRRPEREWDRDRGAGRREARRDDDERPRRDRDGGGVDDRRGPRRERGGHDRGGPDRGGPDRGGMDREFREQQERRRSATPPPKKREPTPDLTDVISVLERQRRMTNWDIKPPGYENVTAEQAKLSGMFPLPGAPRQQAVDPTKLQAFMTQPTGTVTNSALRPVNARQSKRLLVSNLPPDVTDDSLLGFFNLQLNGLNVIDSPDPCVLAQISPDRAFALVEFRTAPDTTVAFALDTISIDPDEQTEGNWAADGAGLTIRRPKDYIVPAVVDDAPYEPGIVSPLVIDTPHKMSVSRIPQRLTSDQIQEYLAVFGPLKAFILVKDRHTDESRGIAFCEYVDQTVTEAAIDALDGAELDTARIKVRKASSGIAQVAGEMGVNAMSMLAGTTGTSGDISRVLQLLNMVTSDELMDNDDYEEICEDVRDECQKYGTIVELKVPRPVGSSRQSAGVGKIFVKFSTADAATKALKSLAGRKFADRTVVSTYFPEENFDVNAW